MQQAAPVIEHRTSDTELIYMCLQAWITDQTLSKAFALSKVQATLTLATTTSHSPLHAQTHTHAHLHPLLHRDAPAVLSAPPIQAMQHHAQGLLLSVAPLKQLWLLLLQRSAPPAGVVLNDAAHGLLVPVGCVCKE